MTAGEKIKAARKAAGLTQAELGEKLGVSYANIAQWENSCRTPKLTSLERIAAALDVDVRELVGDLVLPPRAEDLTPQLVVDALTTWAKSRLDDAHKTASSTEIAYNVRCSLALANAAEIIKAVFPDDF